MNDIDWTNTLLACEHDKDRLAELNDEIDILMTDQPSTKDFKELIWRDSIERMTRCCLDGDCARCPLDYSPDLECAIYLASEIDKLEETRLRHPAKKFDIECATLLSAQDAYVYLIDDDKIYSSPWWLRTPGGGRSSASFVTECGNVDEEGYCVESSRLAVRPVLKLKSSDLEIDDTFEFGGKTFVVISESLAFCTGDIGHHEFRAEWAAKDASDYEKSDVKRLVDRWFTSSYNEWKGLNENNNAAPTPSAPEDNPTVSSFDKMWTEAQKRLPFDEFLANFPNMTPEDINSAKNIKTAEDLVRWLIS